MELADKPTCSIQSEERKVFDLFRHAALRLSAVLHVFKLKRLRFYVQHKIREADRIIQTSGHHHRQHQKHVPQVGDVSSAHNAPLDADNVSVTSLASSNHSLTGPPTKDDKRAKYRYSFALVISTIICLHRSRN